MKKLHEQDYHKIQIAIRGVIKNHERPDVEALFAKVFVPQLKRLNFSGEVHTNAVFYHPNFGIRIFDVFIPSKGLLIEVDGTSHRGPYTKEGDVTKNRFAEELGCDVIRIENGEVFDFKFICGLARQCVAININKKNQNRMKQQIWYWRNRLFKAGRLNPVVKRIERPELKGLGIACYSHFYGCAFHLRSKRPKQPGSDFSKVNFGEGIMDGFLKLLAEKKRSA